MGEEHAKKVSITDEERLELVTKLDNDLDSWMEGLEKKSYTEGWAEDRWQEEMEKHPFFMTKFPENHNEASPLLQGIQQLKYDTTANTPLELAQSYKEDGNFNFKYKKYRMAVISYTEGIRANCGDADLIASLYNNRSAANFFLKNYRSSLADCKLCLKQNPNHDKAQLRAIQCCLASKNPKEAIELCDSFLERHPNDKQALDYKKEAIAIQRTTERDKRKRDRLEEREQNAIKALHAAINSRGVKIEISGGDAEEILLGMHEKPQLQNDGSLTWPVFFLYPEYATSDLIKEFHENTTMQSMMEEVFNERPEWDENGVYKPGSINVYYEGTKSNHLYLVNIENDLGTILKGKELVVKFWRPTFLIFAKDTKAESEFLKKHTVLKSF